MNKNSSEQDSTNLLIIVKIENCLLGSALCTQSLRPERARKGELLSVSEVFHAYVEEGDKCEHIDPSCFFGQTTRRLRPPIDVRT